MDSELRYHQHLANISAKGTKAAMALKRLHGISPSTARKLFVATVEPVIDYASSVWMHTCRGNALRVLGRIQRIGAQAVTGVFRTVAIAIGEAEASLRTITDRHKVKALNFWINYATLPKEHPIARIKVQAFKRFVSPLQKIAQLYHNVPIEKIEKIIPYATAPWEDRVQLQAEYDSEAAIKTTPATQEIKIFTSVTTRHGIVRGGAYIEEHKEATPTRKLLTAATTRGTWEGHNPYSAELGAIAIGLEHLPQDARKSQITVISSNLAALKALIRPRQQSGQDSMIRIYRTIHKLRVKENRVLLRWIPAKEDLEAQRKAKETARQTEETLTKVQDQPKLAKSTVLNRAIKAREQNSLPIGIGKYSKKIDAALPGRHTRRLYDSLTHKEATVLAQLRTGMIRLNSYLYQIGATESAMCTYGQARETVKHFLFRCTRWDMQRTCLLQ